MLNEKVKDFLEKQLADFDNITYSLEEEEEYLYVNFSQILGDELNKEFTFKLIDDVLYFHSSFGWKAVQKGSLNKYFWIDLIKE